MGGSSSEHPSTYNYDSYGEIQDYQDHSHYDHWIDHPWDMVDGTESGDTDDYDDYNQFFKITLSTSNPVTYLDGFREDFRGKSWYAKDFFRRLYLRNFMVATRKFILDLGNLDWSNIPASKRLQIKLDHAQKLIKSAEKFYDSDQFKTIIKIVEAAKLAQDVLEGLRDLEIRGRLKEWQ